MKLQSHLDYVATLDVSAAPTTACLLDTWREVPPFLRALLTADGTVTLLLAAYFNEPIDIRLMGQGETELATDIPALGLAAGERAFYRGVDLIGRVSGNCYASAMSVLNPGALPTSLFNALTSEDVGMGEVLRNASRGSYREVIDVIPVGDDVQRTYTVALGVRPGILITETFRMAAFG